MLGGRLGPSGAPAKQVRLFAASGGRLTWTLRPARDLPAGAALDFVTSRIGYAVIDRARYLLRTTDGGHYLAGRARANELTRQGITDTRNH